MPELSIMIKPASSLCNLRCEYCFYHDVSQIREEHNLGIMSAETSDRLIKSALSFAKGDSVAFAFQGGEPLLAGIDYFRDFAERVKKYNLRGSRIFFSIQTNGLLIDEQWARFFHDEHFLVGLSLDGDMEANRFRVDANGTNRFYKNSQCRPDADHARGRFQYLNRAHGLRCREYRQDIFVLQAQRLQISSVHPVPAPVR